MWEVQVKVTLGHKSGLLPYCEQEEKFFILRRESCLSLQAILKLVANQNVLLSNSHVNILLKTCHEQMQLHFKVTIVLSHFKSLNLFEITKIAKWLNKSFYQMVFKKTSLNDWYSFWSVPHKIIIFNWSPTVHSMSFYYVKSDFFNSIFLLMKLSLGMFWANLNHFRTKLRD